MQGHLTHARQRSAYGTDSEGENNPTAREPRATIRTSGHQDMDNATMQPRNPDILIAHQRSRAMSHTSSLDFTCVNDRC